MILQCYIVNSFSTKLRLGNPAGVVLCGELTDDIMQTIAFEINKSETAFVSKLDASGSYSIRWFSPIREVSLCGHATLAASRIIFNNPMIKEISFTYGNGKLFVKRNKFGMITMSFPLDNYQTAEIDSKYYDFFGIDKINSCFIGEKTKKVVLVLDEKVNLKEIDPNFSIMKEYHGQCMNGICITKKSRNYDFESRFFNPWYGVNEDPVTGSVHTLLAKYWGNILMKKEMHAFQSSHRPGDLFLSVNDERVSISGDTRVVFQGTIEV